MARRHGVRVVNWHVAYRKGCFLFSHGDTYHHTLLSEPTSTWEDMAWSPESDRRIAEYLQSRWYGTEDWIVYHTKVDPAPGWDRVIRTQKFSWNADGSPNFGVPVPSSPAIPMPSGQCKP